MSNNSDLKKTPLNDWHLTRHANMAEFGGYRMPLWYQSGTKQEHLAVISAAGLFDTSHMATITLSGSGAFDLLQNYFSKDLSRCIGLNNRPLDIGRSVYGMFFREDGTVLDDAIVSMLGPSRYMVVVNSGMGAKVSSHLSSAAGSDVVITDYTDKLGKIDIQGPLSAAIIADLLEQPDAVLDDMVYFSFKGDIFESTARSLSLRGGIPVILSRTGYTGEFGFELFVWGEDTEQVWNQLMSAGEEYGLTACGLAARDSLRAGAVLPLSHQDIGDWVFAATPWSFVLPWDDQKERFTKVFMGDEALLAGATSSYTYAFAGYDPRKIGVTEETEVLDKDLRKIGIVLTCTTDISIGRENEKIVGLASGSDKTKENKSKIRGLSCGFVKISSPRKSGDRLFLRQGKRKIEVEIREDVRPDRTARRPMKQMRNKQ